MPHPSTTSENSTKSPHDVVFYTYPMLLFAWPIILLGHVLSSIDQDNSSEVLAWIWSIVLIVTIVTISVDIGRNAMAF